MVSPNVLAWTIWHVKLLCAFTGRWSKTYWCHHLQIMWHGLFSCQRRGWSTSCPVSSKIYWGNKIHSKAEVRYTIDSDLYLLLFIAKFINLMFSIFLLPFFLVELEEWACSCRVLGWKNYLDSTEWSKIYHQKGAALEFF